MGIVLIHSKFSPRSRNAARKTAVQKNENAEGVPNISRGLSDQRVNNETVPHPGGVQECFVHGTRCATPSGSVDLLICYPVGVAALNSRLISGIPSGCRSAAL